MKENGSHASDKGLIYKKLKTTQQQNNKSYNFKMASRFKWVFLKRSPTDGPQFYEKVFNIPSCQGKAK